MHLGSFSSLDSKNNKNLKYILVDNASHESIGGQPINLKNVNVKLLASALNFKNFYFSNKKKDLPKKFDNFIKSIGPSFFHQNSKWYIKKFIKTKKLN